MSNRHLQKERDHGFFQSDTNLAQKFFRALSRETHGTSESQVSIVTFGSSNTVNMNGNDSHRNCSCNVVECWNDILQVYYIFLHLRTVGITHCWESGLLRVFREKSIAATKCTALGKFKTLEKSFRTLDFCYESGFFKLIKNNFFQQKTFSERNLKFYQTI